MAKHVVVTPERWLPKGETEVTAGQHVPMVVWGGIVGEEARVKVVHKGQNQARAIFEETDTPSPHRMQIPCDRYDPCGGCPMLHTDPEMQEMAHRSRVREALDRAGLDDVGLGAFTRSPRMFDFRHVVKLGWGWSFDGKRSKVGAWGRRDRRIVPIPKCNVAAPVLRRVMTSLAHHSIEMGLVPYDPISDEGVMRGAVIRASSKTGEVLVTLVAGRIPKKLDELAERIAQDNGEVVGVWVHVNMDEGNGLFHADEDGSIGMKALTGRDWIEEELDGIGIRVGPGDFYQTNPAMALPLYERTLNQLAPGPEDAVVDLYSGVGGLTLLAARRCGLAIGVEAVEGAVRRARESARRNRLNAEFIAGDVQEELPAIAKRLSHPLVIVDPARRGLHPDVREGLVEMRPRKLAYISCNASSMARDLAVFREAGAIVHDPELFDMFPHTAHVECLTIVEFEVEEARRAPRRKLLRKG
ncbi:MAG: 23S rRNA (uracil(1939)-C(5))-methyltransferase RlmD [Myxococcales bacterium]|nr:23S rRNA (uracil(1939)-C(5))-methyltransferase RlmD [Myxococcales bacterium]MCB9669921.1 23S rRNA (uracil(1939)-C(5))-methyltransferase RlmD [Alphaproteobacteria bacterium]MCB9693205.1 23S rRNA (uracil(1939)-C(5))-methyltransferase RlmD [Alphaproteobacteria bacterium]